MKRMYRALMTGYGLRPDQIDNLTPAQTDLYFDDEPDPEAVGKAEERQMQIYRKGLRLRLEGAGHEVPANLHQLTKDEMDALWFSVNRG